MNNHYNMSEELQQQLRAQLWNVANTLRGNMSAGDFMYFSLGFIFYKYLSEKIEKAVAQAITHLKAVAGHLPPNTP